jgi:ADP-glucose pyrophosphorylase
MLKLAQSKLTSFLFSCVITNCVVSDDVTIEDKCVLSDCVILSNSLVTTKTELTNANFPQEERDLF